MRDYQPAKNNKYQLDPVIYKLILCSIRAYPRLKKDVKNASYIPCPDLEVTRSGNSVKPTHTSYVERKAITLAKKDEIITAIDDALQIVPEEYRKPIIDNIVKSVPWYMCDYASDSTLKRHKARFIYKVAYNLNYI